MWIKIKGIKGQDKHELCISIVTTTVKNLDVPDKDKIVNCLEGLPDIVNTIVMASNGSIDINQAINSVAKIIKKLKACFPKK